MSLETVTNQSKPSTSGIVEWTVDPSHTSVTFGVRHMMVSTVRGVFHKVSGSVGFDPKNPEKSWATPGDRGVQTCDTEYGRVGLGICFDIHTVLEKYEPHHIWCLLYPIAWVDAEHPADWMWSRLPERVKPFKHHLVGANWSVDKKQDWRGYGFSVVLSNEGQVVASAKSLYGSEIVYAELPTAK